MELAHQPTAEEQIAPPVSLPLQETSQDIWDTKYRLKRKDGTPVDATVDETYQRVARALANVESTPAKREEWYEKFLWALRHGAIPAGRIVSNAGALEHKPATSTINCTVSGTVQDSMNGILEKVYEGGLTLKAGCGIGYEFSTLRPRGAYVTGAGAYTSGPLSFMDIYDKMCFTVSSAGGRRGAQMATFDIGHPDVMNFIRAKREDGRLRQFNLSLLITREFMEAVRNDGEWKLAFPITAHEAQTDEMDLSDPSHVIWREWPIKDGYVVDDAGRVACKIYKTVRARRVWDVIMTSTYDFAEPGFILIDEINEMNNNWFCENVRATNPCVTADTWVHTSEGPRLVSDLLGRPFFARIHGTDYATGARGFFQTAVKSVVRLRTWEGYSLRLTIDHRVRRVSYFTRYTTESEWCEAGDLRPGDRVILHDHRSTPTWDGALNFDEGYLLGLLVGDGRVTRGEAVLSVWKPAAVANSPGNEVPGRFAIMDQARRAIRNLSVDGDTPEWDDVSGRSEYRLNSPLVKRLADRVGLAPGEIRITENMERGSSRFYQGFLRGFFDADGSVQGSQSKGVSVRLSQSSLARLEAAQRMLLRLGIASRIYRDRRHNGFTVRFTANQSDTALKAQHELVITGENLQRFAELIGFSDAEKLTRLERSLDSYKRALNRERFTACVESITAEGFENVYDVQVPGVNAFDANGLYAHNCGEQPLPPYGSCLLGSVNLTNFVIAPFSDNASFDWETYRRTVAVFTRMLDNVVEINGLPLEKQRREIEQKRRHGMGFLGLGSTLTMLGYRYGGTESLEFTERVTRELALMGWQVALELAKEKGPAPILEQAFEITDEMMAKRPELGEDGFEVGDKVAGKVLHARYSRYMQKIAAFDPELVDQLAETGARFTHHSSIAPTGTISLSLANNASNGIEPSFAHHYSRNVIREGRKTKEKVDVFSAELLAYRELVNPTAMPGTDDEASQLPDYFVAADDITPKEHVDVQAAAQKWIDSSISKTANVPTNYAYEDFKDIYMYAYEQGLKGCTTFRFNPEAFQGVLVKQKDLENTTYRFVLEDGTSIEAQGDQEVEYDGEIHTAANLYDAIKEGYYGKL